MLHQLEFYIFIVSRGPILESQGMCAIFQKTSNKKRQKKNKKRAKYLKIWANMYKIWKYFEKGWVIVCDYHTQ